MKVVASTATLEAESPSSDQKSGLHTPAPCCAGVDASGPPRGFDNQAVPPSGQVERPKKGGDCHPHETPGLPGMWRESPATALAVMSPELQRHVYPGCRRDGAKPDDFEAGLRQEALKL